MAGEKELKTSLVLEAKTKGFENAQKRAEKLRDALSAPNITGSFGRLDKSLAGVEKAFGKITGHLDKMNRAMERFEKSVNALSRRMRQMGPGGGGAPGPLGPLGGGGPPAGGPTGAAPPVSNPATPGTGRPWFSGRPYGPQLPDHLLGRGYFPSHALGPDLPPGWHSNRYTGRSQRDMSPWVQGMFQGAGFGEYIPRDQGIRPMLQQAAGRFIGGAARRGVHAGMAFAGSPFTGLEGITTGLAAIPGGGIVGGQLQAAMSNAQAALGVERSEMALAPYLPSGAIAASAISNARAAEAARFNVSRIYPEYFGAEKGFSRTQGEIDIRAAAEQSVSGKFTGQRLRKRGGLKMRALPQESTSQSSDLTDRVIETQEYEETSEYRARTEALAKLAKAAGDTAAKTAFDRAMGLGGLEAGGKFLMGVGRSEALEFGGQLLHAGGGTLAGAREQRMIRASMAAHTAFGVDAGTSGAFLRAGREGGMVGGGLGGDMLAKTIGDAMRMGLEGSEITEYLQTTANALNEFKTTGMPVNSRSMSMLGATMATSGLGVMRGAAVGAQLTSAAQRISTAGPTSAAEFQLLQTMGGFQGGGLQELEDSLGALQTADYTGPGFQEFIRRSLSAGGGGAGGRFALRRAMSSLGANVNIEESKALERFAIGEDTAADRKNLELVRTRLREGAEGAPEDTKALGARARDIMSRMGGNLARQAELDNERIRLGKSFIGSMHDLEGSTQNVQKAFEKCAPEIQKVIEFIKSISDTFPGLVEKFKSVAEFGKAAGGKTATPKGKP